MISIVMPAFNEAAMLEDSVTAIVSALRSDEVEFELHVVENGSTDGTPSVLARLARDLPEVVPHSLRAADYGEALRTGLLEARGDAGVVFDVDYYDLRFLKEALELLDTSADPVGPVVVVGSKRAPGASDQRGALRRLATSAFTAVLQRGFGLTLTDTHGVKVLNLEALRPTVRVCRLGTDLFDTELILRAERSGYRTAEIPVSVHERRPSRTPILRRVPRTLVGLVRLRQVLGPRTR
ncbi:MAG TPA: glycosyltransferase [Acidimicrobiia bacterium]